MSFRGIVRDIRDGLGSLSRRSFELRLPGHTRGKSHGSQDFHDEPQVVQTSRWSSLPPELLRDVIRRLEASEATWPARKHVVACAAVCRSWRAMCKEIVRCPEISGKITFPVSLKQVLLLKISLLGSLVTHPSVILSGGRVDECFPTCLEQPGPRDGTMQCFIKRDKSKLTYRLFLCLSPGKFPV